jgi:hypothetical protein
MGCFQSKSIRLKLVRDEQLGAWKLSGTIIQGKSKEKKSHRFLSAMARQSPLNNHLRFGHIRQHILLVYNLKANEAWHFGQGVGKAISDSMCSWGFDVPIKLVAQGIYVGSSRAR